MTVKESGIAEIYTKNTDTFSVGRVFCQNNECVVFEDIDTQGKITGYYVMKKEIISRLEYDTEYLNKISKYMELRMVFSKACCLKHRKVFNFAGASICTGQRYSNYNRDGQRGTGKRLCKGD